MSLRERRKQERRDAILRAAKEIFSELGFSSGTMDEIANRAGVGVATVYKYFGAKANILESLVVPSLENAFTEAEKVIATPPANVEAGAVMALLIDKYRYFGDNWSDRRMLREVSMPGISGEAVVDELIMKSNARVQRQIRDLLLVLKGRGDIDPTLNLEDATAIIFSIFNQHYETFVTHEDIPARQMFSDIARRIQLIFKSWENDSKS